MTATSVRHPGEFRWETRLLAVVTMMLVLFGIAACYAAGSYLPTWFDEARDQVSGAAVGGLAFLALAYLDYNHLRRIAVPLFWATVIGLAMIALAKIAFPSSTAPAVVNQLFPWVNGARRWVQLPGMRIQVSELARLTLPIFIAASAAAIGTRVRDFRQGFVALLWPVALIAALTMIQPNLSMAIILTLTGVAVAFVAGVRLTHLLLMPAVAVPAVAVMFLGSRERLERLSAWWQPSINCPATEQHCESLIGFGHGGLFGVGFGKGTQKLGHLAYGHSDYILSIIGEEWGLVGVLFLIACFTLFCWMGFRIARTARDPFGAALAAGLTTAIAVGALMHAAVVTDLMPSTGQTLPFVSTGRVALVIYLAATGIIISIGRRRGRPARARAR